MGRGGYKMKENLDDILIKRQRDRYFLGRWKK
jgi:hypothetical protein